MEARLEFQWGNTVGAYAMSLNYAAGDTLIFADETLNFEGMDFVTPATVELGAGHQETKINKITHSDFITAVVLKGMLKTFFVYHFHDTSPTARVRQYGYIGDDIRLASDAGNLAAVLYRLRTEDRTRSISRI